MRVGILSYPMLFQREGGLQVQVRETIAALNHLEANMTAELVDPSRQQLAEFDLVHVFSAFNGNVRVVESAADLGVPVVLSPLVSPSWNRNAGLRMRVADRLAGRLSSFNVQTSYAQTKRALQLADMVIALGDAEREAIVSGFLTERSKIRVFPNGISRQFFTAKAELFRHRTGVVGPFVLCVGAISPYKNQLGLAQALEGSELPLVLIGPVARSDHAYLQKVLASPWVRWIGALDHEDPLLASAFAAASVLALPSQGEIFPLSVLEALAAGTPVVMTQDSALHIEGAQRVLRKVAWNDATGQRAALVDLAARPPERAAVQAMVEQFTWQRVAAQVASCYRELVPERKVLFNSFAFIFLFLPVALAGYQLLRRHGVLWLALCSLFFYAWWDWRFLPLLLMSICLNFVAGRAICKLDGWARTLAFYGALAINLGLLVWFKYADFLFGIHPGLPLPIGISFFTFTQLAFLVDCWHGKAREARLGPYVLFVSYFPHLVAGPVLHHAEMMPQFRNGQSLRANDLAAGLTIFAIGLAKKVLIADNLAPLANPIFAADASPQLVEAWIGTLAYSMQLYFDFSGYSDMAIGLSLLFGVRLPENFNSPYQARNIAEFWRRWHMTLSRFLRDYLYVPLGGNRHGAWARQRNLLLTMVLGGAWHGAGWTFLAWGGLHGVFLILHQRFAGAAARWWGRPLTFLAVLLAWVPFRAPDMAVALDIWCGMAGMHGLGLPRGLGGPGLQWVDAGGFALPLLAGAALLAWFAPNTRQLMEGRWKASLPHAGTIAALLLACIFSMNRPTEFLYFQF